jgi:hypothetical protein
VGIRRKAAEVAYELHAPATVPQLRRAFARDEDDEVRRWSALALARAGETPPAVVETMLHDPSREWKRRAALTVGERGSFRACEVLNAWWNEIAPVSSQADPDGEPPQLPLDLPHTRELLAATAHAHCRGSVPALLASLKDVRARPYVADALGAIGDNRARGPLLTLLASEPYVTTRPHEADAVLALDAGDGITQPWLMGPASTVKAPRKAPKGPARLVVVLTDPAATLQASVDGKALAAGPVDGPIRSMPLPPGHGPMVQLVVQAGSGTIRAIWVAASVAASAALD